MAHNLDSPLGISCASSIPDSSPTEILGDTRIRLSLVKISRQQKDLLYRPESWASSMAQRPSGFVNIPLEVLDQLKSTYARQRQAIAPSQKIAKSTIHTAGQTNVPEPSKSQSSLPPHIDQEVQNSDSDDLEDSEDHEDDDSDKGEEIPWSSSPVRPAPKMVETEDTSQLFMTQLPGRSSPMLTVPPLPEHSNLPKFPPFPQSSQGPDEDDEELELEVPAALTHDQISVNKSALPILATPPSAQVVPCSIEESVQSISTNTSITSAPQPKPKSRRPIYKSVPELYRPPKQGTVSSHLHINVVPAKADIASDQGMDVDSSLPAGNTPSSTIPSTNHECDVESQKHTSAWDVQPAQITTSGTNLSPDGRHSPLASRSYSSPTRIVCSPPRQLTVTHSATPLAVASKSWDPPFDHYTATYPTYNGTIQDFITACIYIQLQYRKIRTCLFDDFIRAWVQGYLPYVRYCDEVQPPKKAVRAIDWYNEIDDDPLFTSRVVTRQNLQFILNSYPNELQMARRALGIPSNQVPGEQAVFNSPTGAYVHKDNVPSQLPARLSQLKGKEPARKSIEVATRAPKPPPIAKPTVPHFPADQHIIAHQSFGGIGSRRTESKGLTRSLSETISHKRKAPDEVFSKGAKRISLGPTLEPHNNNNMWSDTGSTISNHSDQSMAMAQSSAAPESSATKRQSSRVIEDPEKRRRRLAKHFKKKVEGKRESIASSVPLSNTPTSGQRSLR